MQTITEYDIELDATGLNCPLPILRTKKALVTMQSGQVLHVIATDPASDVDFHAFAAQSGNDMVDFFVDRADFHFLLKKG